MATLRSKLTVRLVESVKPSASDIFVWDTEVPGFGLRVWPSGKRVFVFQYRTKHRQTRRPVIGVYGSMRPERARTIAKDWAEEVRHGRDPGGERREAAQAPTVADLA